MTISNISVFIVSLESFESKAVTRALIDPLLPSGFFTKLTFSSLSLYYKQSSYSESEDSYISFSIGYSRSSSSSSISSYWNFFFEHLFIIFSEPNWKIIDVIITLVEKSLEIIVINIYHTERKN